MKTIRDRMVEYLKRNPLTKEQLELWASAEDDATCKKCGRVIFCGDLDKMCGDPECSLKRIKNE